MKAPGWAYAAGAGLLVGAVAVWSLCLSQRRAERAADQATIAAHAQTIAALQAQVGRLDTIYVERTKERIRTATRWDTVRTVVDRVDTLISVDTLRLVVATADTAIRACTLAVETCEQRTAALRSIISADSSQVRALSRELARAKIRSRLACTVGPSATVVAGAVRVGYVGASCGFRVF